MDIKDLKAVYRFLRETDIVELDIEGPEGKMRIRRGSVAAQALQAAAPLPAPVEAPVAPAAAKKEPEKEKAENIKVVTSPMVGTFYRCASPEAPPFMELGALVKTGQTLCIIEAMKLMNEVESEFNGKVVSVLVENGQPVEYGEPLFHIEVSK